jgi:hypothetical protein
MLGTAQAGMSKQVHCYDKFASAFLFLHCIMETMYFQNPHPFAKIEGMLEVEYLGICSSNCIVILTSRETGMPRTKALHARSNDESNKRYWQYKIKFT